MNKFERLISEHLKTIKAVEQDEGRFKTICDEGPLLELIREFHGPELPRDWIFDKTLNLLVQLGDFCHHEDPTSIEDLRDFAAQAADSEVSIYNDELLVWSRTWYYLIEEYRDEGLISFENCSFIELISSAQYYKLDSMAQQLIDFLNEEIQNQSN